MIQRQKSRANHKRLVTMIVRVFLIAFNKVRFYLRDAMLARYMLCLSLCLCLCLVPVWYRNRQMGRASSLLAQGQSTQYPNLPSTQCKIIRGASQMLPGLSCIALKVNSAAEYFVHNSRLKNSPRHVDRR